MDAGAVLDRLRAAATPATRAGLARYGIPDARALGVAMRDMQAIARSIGKDPALADALWATGVYEARIVALFLTDPARLPRATADARVAEFDSWALADTAAFHLFDRTPYAWQAAPDWLADPAEFTRRTGYALYWALALHDKAAPDAAFAAALADIEAAEPDPRPLIRKAAVMALGVIGRRNAPLLDAAMASAQRLAADPDRAAVGRAALKTLAARSPRPQSGAPPGSASDVPGQ